MSARHVALQAVGVTIGLYGTYAIAGEFGVPTDLRFVGLIAAFYFLPSWLLRSDPERQRAYQVGPGGVLPPWSTAGLRWAVLAMAIVFPVFVLGFLGFYRELCTDGSTALHPWASDAGIGRLCGAHNHAFWPDRWSVPRDWTRYGGAGALVAVAVEIFAIALPEELFHRGYLMSALEERWPPKAQVWGVSFGWGAVSSSALFAVGHLVGMMQTSRLATFFPALVFAWLWRRSGSLWAPTLFHAGSNLLMGILITSTFPA